jgi:hypothetical protein
MKKFDRGFDVTFDWKTFRESLIQDVPVNLQNEAVETFDFELFF